MKLKRLILGAVVALTFTPIANTNAANTQDFYFEDFTADYYLTKLDDGTSNLHVKEVLTAVFPESDQNHGITRTIPYANQGGENITVPSDTALNLTVLRNGQPENINKIEKNSGYYTVYIGKASEYVHGEQVYTLEYDYTDVITEFDTDGVNVSGRKDAQKVLQELYWDTNGTGWSQSFERLTANLHATEDIYKNMDKTAWCYVGKYGDKGSDRCTITPTSDGFSFETASLKAGENLTFVAEFKPDTFNVILEKSYVLVIVLVIEILIAGIVLIKNILKWRKKAKLQYNLYKATFVVPQYQPPEDESIHAAEGEQIYLKKTKTSYVATLLELAVSKKVTIKKAEDNKKYDWAVVLNVEPEELTGPQKQMLRILSNDEDLARGSEVPIEKHKPTRRLAICAEKYRDEAFDALVKGRYLDNETIEKQSKYTVAWVILFFIILFAVGYNLGNIMNAISGILIPSPNAIIVGVNIIPVAIVVTLFVSVAVNEIITKNTKKYKDYTESGVKLARYLEGLKLYITMAESDRLKFLQSVEGADMSNAGMVKLYERLLPWASLFGAEESWVKELAKYYDVENMDDAISIGILDGIAANNIARDINRVVTSSTNYREPSSAGGSWSSSSSGGSSSGGGGFSGGGGGGGGGGGW